jgi:hypothetical protein
LLVSFGLFLAKEEHLDDSDHAKSNQDKRANQCPGDLCLIDDPDCDGYGAKES